jgi:hypothetical protein
MSLWLSLVLAILATWRITHLLTDEDGPADIAVRFRTWVRDSLIGRMLDCFLCTSVWVSLPLALFVTRVFPDVLVAWWAISGGACLLERIGQPGVTIRALPDEPAGEQEHGLLRSTKNGS